MNDIETILHMANIYENRCINDLVKIAKTRKSPNGRSSAPSKKIKKVDYLKHFDHSEADDTSAIIDLTDIDEFAYSAVMRKIRQKATPEQTKVFLQLFKQQFDRAVKGKSHKPERIALQNTLIKFNKLHKIKLDKKMVKLAAIAELGNSEQVGKYLSDIVRFTLQRIPADKRQGALDSLKSKFSTMNESEIASKHLPESSALGQAITFVKHVLFNHDAKYVKEVLNSLARSL
jgi:hypothetical protein